MQARGECKGTEVSVASRASVPNAAVMKMPGIKAARDSTCTVPRGGNRLSPRNQQSPLGHKELVSFYFDTENGEDISIKLPLNNTSYLRGT